MAKLRVHELAAELDIGNKEILHILRDQGIQVKSHMSALEEEEAQAVRDSIQGAKPETEVIRKEVQPGVIVRRRKRVKPARRAEEPQPEEAEAEEEVRPEAEAAVETAGEPAGEPAAEQAAEPVAEAAEAESEPETTPPAAEGKSPAEARKKAADTARIITPEEIAAKTAAEEPQEAAAEEPVAEEAPAATAAEAEEAAPEAAAEPEAEEAAPAEEAAEEAGEEAKEAAAEEAGESEEAPAKKKKKKSKKKEKFSGPQVTVIHRPEVPEVSEEPQEPRAPRGPRAPYPPRAAAGPGARPGARPGRPATTPEPPSPERPGGRKKRKKDKRVVDFTEPGMPQEKNLPQPKKRGPADRPGPKGKGRKRRQPQVQQPAPQAQPSTQPMKQAKRKIRIAEAIRVSDLAHQMGIKAPEVIRVLMGLGIMATINQSLDVDTATLVASEFSYEVEKKGFSEEEFLIPVEEDKPEELKGRPPVVTIMGHVDHGKTSLLDAIRESNITGGEAGGITQHIGAYHVKTKRGELVFLDTPGHEAFTAMRARGAQVTDVVVLVVAADDGVMDQTREAINHSRAAGVPILVAVNKIDKEDSNPDRVKRELAELGLQPEDWGGETIFANVSAKQGIGIDELLELIILQSEVLELKANPDKPARGHIVEAKLDKGRGPLGTLLIQEGTLRQGDAFVCGLHHGKVRAMFNDQGKKIKSAGPAIPVEVQGFDGVPDAGDEFVVVADDKVARKIADERQLKQRERQLAKESKVTLESFLKSRPETEAKTLNLVLKADVQGSLEAIADALHKLSTDEVKIDIIHAGAGAITESDILLASASDAIIIGFNIRPTVKIKEIAEVEQVEIRFYDIIYKLVGDIKDAMTGMLSPVISESYLGQAEVRQTFQVSRVGTVAGCAVTDGKITRNAKIRLVRDGVVIHTGELSTLKRFKDDVREVSKGYECGMTIAKYNDIKVGDVIEAFEMVEEKATLG